MITHNNVIPKGYYYMLYNNRSGCAKMAQCGEIARYDCIGGTCVYNKGGKFGSLYECEKNCSRYICDGTEGCKKTQDSNAPFESLKSCKTKCLTWAYDKQTNNCFKKYKGPYTKSECDDQIQYGCTPFKGCTKSLQWKEGGLNQKECKASCTLWKCDENKCIIAENHDGEYLSKGDCIDSQKCLSWRCNVTVNKCTKQYNDTGGFIVKADCDDNKCTRWGCKKKEGCVPDKDGSVFTKSECEETCSLWDCNKTTNSCMKSNKGEFHEQECKDSCYDGEYNCGENGCILAPKGQKGTFKHEIDCIKSCSFSCKPLLGCVKTLSSNNSYPTKNECNTACTLWSCKNQQCMKSNKGLFLSKSECIKSNNCLSWSCSKENNKCVKTYDPCGYLNEQDCHNRCTKWDCVLGSGCIPLKGGIYPSKSECNTKCHLSNCNIKTHTCISDSKGSLHIDDCNIDCIKGEYNCTSSGCVLQKAGIKGTFQNQYDCKIKCETYQCLLDNSTNKALCMDNGYKRGVSKTKSECEKSCNTSYSCSTDNRLGCIPKAHTSSTGIKSLSDCKSSCLSWSCKDGTQCIKTYKGNYKSLGSCKSNCLSWNCNTNKTGCTKSYNTNGSKSESTCIDNCVRWGCYPIKGCSSIYIKL